jgi:hypothetical protein
VTLTAAQVQSIATALHDYVQATVTTLSNVIAAIGVGTTANTYQVDAAAWPTPAATI